MPGCAKRCWIGSPTRLISLRPEPTRTVFAGLLRSGRRKTDQGGEAFRWGSVFRFALRAPLQPEPQRSQERKTQKHQTKENQKSEKTEMKNQGGPNQTITLGQIWPNQVDRII
jgi:hypothetical protein